MRPPPSERRGGKRRAAVPRGGCVREALPPHLSPRSPARQAGGAASERLPLGTGAVKSHPT